MKKERVFGFFLTCKNCLENSKPNIHFQLPFGIYIQCLNCEKSEFLAAPQTKQMTKKRQQIILKTTAN